MWDAIPAWVCDRGDESLFETKEVDAIQEALTVLAREKTSDFTVSDNFDEPLPEEILNTFDRVSTI